MAAADGLMVDSDKATSEKSRLKTKFKFSDVRPGYSNRLPRAYAPVVKLISYWYGMAADGDSDKLGGDDRKATPENEGAGWMDYASMKFKFVGSRFTEHGH
jgi:hypothetical protein